MPESVGSVRSREPRSVRRSTGEVAGANGSGKTPSMVPAPPPRSDQGFSDPTTHIA